MMYNQMFVLVYPLCIQLNLDRLISPVFSIPPLKSRLSVPLHKAVVRLTKDSATRAPICPGLYYKKDLGYSRT